MHGNENILHPLSKEDHVKSPVCDLFKDSGHSYYFSQSQTQIKASGQNIFLCLTLCQEAIFGFICSLVRLWDQIRNETRQVNQI